MKIKDLENYITDNILDTIYREREDNISTRNKEDEKAIAKIEERYPMNYEKLLNCINNLPPHFRNIREDILNSLDTYSMRENLIAAHDNEKFYKIGFCDGIRTILEQLKMSN